MSTFSHTDWTVTCNYGEGTPDFCLAQGRTDTLDLVDGTAATVRAILKSRGWLVNVPNPIPESRRRLDFCPTHRSEYENRRRP